MCVYAAYARAYMPATLDKTLAELALLDVESALWSTHAARWSELTRRWCDPEPGWLQSIAYIDGTADPYWTRAYARSGKVSRVGRVMPCLSRVALHGGAGVPLLIQTFAGAAPLRRSLSPMLAQLREAVGEQASVDRLTVVDSEAGYVGVLWALHAADDVFFVSVVKGQVLAGADLRQEGSWQSFRERDELCEGGVRLFGKDGPKAGLPLRAVLMRRGNSSHPHPHPTVFVTNASSEDLSTEQVASVYLARWPRQEQSFRDGRDGGGLNRSFGFGRELVADVALTGKLEQVHARLRRAKQAHEKAEQTREQLDYALAAAPAQIRAKGLKLADKDIGLTQRAISKHAKDLAALESMPATIQQRDTGRDSIMTCLKTGMLALVEFVQQEYFGGRSANWRSFIEQLVALPVTVRTSPTRRLFLIHENRRQPALMEQLEAALEEINRRELVRDDRKWEFQLARWPIGGP